MIPFRWTLQNKALAAFIVGAGLMLALILITWQGLSRTAAAVNEFEGLLIPEIRNALSLSDEAAQIVALAPYLSSAGQPFQLQTEQKRLDARYNLVYSLSERLQNPTVREQIQSSLADIKRDLQTLTDLVYEQLFIREDLFAAQFEVDQLARRSTRSSQQSANPTTDPWLPLQLYFRSMTQPNEYTRKSYQSLRPLAKAVEQPASYMRWLELASDQYGELQRISQKKAFLLARLRAHSERLTQQTNNFAADIQKVVVRQQKAVSGEVSQALVLTIGLALIVVLAIVVYYLNNRRLIRDLGVVTEDMMQLARGRDAPEKIHVQRDDEIGELVNAYDVFRDHALQAAHTGQELEAQKTLLETVYNQIQDGLSVFSSDDRLVTWNRRYLEIFGFNPDDIGTGMHLDGVQNLMSRKGHQNLTVRHESIDMSALNLERHHSHQNFERHYSDGQIVEFRSQPMPSGGFVTLYSDLTERRTAEEQLQQSQKMDVLGQLTGGVAHDFNNLLGALLGNLQLLERSIAMDATGRKYLDRALDVSERGTQLVQRLLAFSRKQRLQPEVVEMDRVLAGMAELLEYSVSGQIRLELDLNVPGVCLYIDPSQLENAVLNLALNSAAAIATSGCIRIATHKDLQPEYVSIQVEDTGHGVPLTMQKRVLEPFFTTKPVGQGSGLGLSTVYGFAEQSGGRFQLESTPGVGTTITLSWPITDCAETTHECSEVASIPFDRTRGVALVEDDDALRTALADLFLQQGIDVVSFARGEHFIDWAHRSDPTVGLLVSDVNLGGELNGLDVVNQTRINWPDTECVLISGLPREILEQDLTTTIDWPLLQKPITPAMFRQLFPTA